MPPTTATAAPSGTPSAPADLAPPPAPADLAPLQLSRHDRRVLATCLVARMGPAAWALGGYATAAVTVAIRRLAPLRPGVAIVLGEPPVRPIVRTPPRLVVELAPVCAPGEWLRRGVPEVWSVGMDGAWITSADADPRWVPAPGTLQTAQRLTLHLPLRIGEVGPPPGGLRIGEVGPPPGGAHPIG